MTPEWMLLSAAEKRARIWRAISELPSHKKARMFGEVVQLALLAETRGNEALPFSYALALHLGIAAETERRGQS